MNPISDGCRLCLDPSAEIATTIDSPALMDQMEKVFCFSIEPKQGYCSGVCQNCSHTISDFYQFSEKVRKNQEILNGNVTNCDQTKDSKISLECVKQEPINDFGLPETIDDTHEPDSKVSEAEEDPIFDSKIQTPSDSDMMETNQDACELKHEVSEVDEEIQTLHSEITLEDFKIVITDSDLPKTIHEEKEIPIVDSKITFENGKVETPSESELSETTEQIIKKTPNRKKEDELFKKHISLVCELCGILADSYPALCSHFKEEHQTRDSYVVCCNQKLFRRSQIREHINFHANPDLFRCKVCGFRLKRRDSLNIHMLKKHPHTLKCEHCPKSFAEESALTKHKRLHLDNMKLQCPKCYKFYLKKSLRLHMLRNHTEKKRKKSCNICGKEYETIEGFNKHMKKHMGIETQKFKCKICQMGYMKEQSLNHHMNTQHATDEVQCDQCSKKFKHPRALHAHKQWWHTEPKHECEYCGLKFKLPYLLKKHRAIHTGEVLFTCECCGKSYNCRSNMMTHMQRHHPAEWEQKKLLKT